MVSMMGIATQGTRAMAKSQVAAGNALKCIKPWIVSDKWVDNSNTGSDPSGYDQLDSFNPGVDTYTPFGWLASGNPNDYGTELALKGDGNDWSSGWTLEIDLNGGNGGNVYRDEIAGCPSWVPTVGLYVPGTACSNNPGDVDYGKGCLNVKTGVKQGPTSQGVDTLKLMDPGATWNTTTNSVQNSCIQDQSCTNPTGADVSPRVVPLAIFDPQAYADGGFTGNGGMARVTNLLGFFVEGMCDQVYPVAPPAFCGTHPDQVVVGRLMAYPGQHSSGSGPAGPATFVKFTRLVQ